jgi:murein L,D-transpeptidase YafK
MPTLRMSKIPVKMRCYCLLLFLLLGLSVPGLNAGRVEDLYTVKVSRDNIDPDKVFLLIDKSDYRLYLYEDVTLRKVYKVVFGSRDQSDKRQEGDKRTPEGTFHIQAKRFDKSWSRFMLLDYPNQISWTKFHQLQAEGEISPNATIGGGIGIHGVEYESGIRDNYVESRINWTLGCISMKTQDVAELYEIIKVGTPVVIRR